MPQTSRVSLCVLPIYIIVIGSIAQAANFTTEDNSAVKFGVHEIVLSGDGSTGNPFDTVATVTFTPPFGVKQAKTVYAFYDGGNTWRARVYVSEVGKWNWISTCNTDQALDGRSGTFDATSSKLRGRLLPHSKDPRQWMTEDGRWFLNMVDTAYFLLSPKDYQGQVITEQDFHDYVRDAVDHGVTSFMTQGIAYAKSVSEEQSWTAKYFEDAGLTRLRLDNFRFSDQRLRWLLDHYPDVGIELILFPRGAPYGADEKFWKKLTAAEKERILRYVIARYAAYPQLFWLIANDTHYGEKFPNNNAYAREVGDYFQQHDPWRHPVSTGHARHVDFFFGDEDWATFLHLENAYDLGASQCAKHYHFGKPVLMGEERYEQDHPNKLDPINMRYYQRRLYWAWLLSGGSANYGGRWWVLHPYTQTGKRPTPNPRPSAKFTHKTALCGLDCVKFIRDYFANREIELSDFEPEHSLASSPDGGPDARAPKLMRRGHEEFLIYHPNAAADAREAKPHSERKARLRVDLRKADGLFAVEWYRAHDGIAQKGEQIAGGKEVELTAPWPGHDVVLRLVRVGGLVAIRDAQAGEPDAKLKTYTYKTAGDLPIKADVYRLPGNDVRPVIVWIHGGGLITGGRGGPNPEQRKRYLGAGYVIVSIDYRLAPETKLAGILEDVRDAITWVRDKGPELYQIDPTRVAIVGHSAGGYLTLMAGFTVEPRPQALIAFYGYGNVDGDWYAKPYAYYREVRPLFTKEEAYKAIGAKETINGGAKGRGNFYTYCRQNGLWPQEVVGYDPVKQPREFDRYCPVRNVTSDYPPTLLLHGDADTDVPHAQSVAMAAELKRIGVAHEFISVPGGEHGFDAKGMKDTNVSAAFERIEMFLRKHVGK